MSITKNVNNGVNGAGTNGEGPAPNRCPTEPHGGPDRHQATAMRKDWTKKMNMVVMECYFRSNPVDENGIPPRRYRQRLLREWNERGLFPTTEQRLCDQARVIRETGWLTEVELEEIKRKIWVDNGKEENFNEEIDGNVGLERSEGEHTENEERLILEIWMN